MWHQTDSLPQKRHAAGGCSPDLVGQPAMELAAVHVHAPEGRELAYLRGNGGQRALSNIPAAVEAWHSVLLLGVLNENVSDAVCMHEPGCNVVATTLSHSHCSCLRLPISGGSVRSGLSPSQRRCSEASKHTTGGKFLNTCSLFLRGTAGVQLGCACLRASLHTHSLANHSANVHPGRNTHIIVEKQRLELGEVGEGLRQVAKCVLGERECLQG